MQDQPPVDSNAHARPPADARCAVHADAEAFAVCRRCGNYMCRACSRDGTSPQCDSCRARGAAEFPFSRERWSFSDLISYCGKRFEAEWLTLSLTALIFLALLYGISFALTFGSVLLIAAVPDGVNPDASAAATVLRVSIQIAQFLLQIVIQMWLQLGFFSVVLDVAEGRRAEIGRLFSRLDRFPAALLQVLVIYGVLLVYAAPIVAAYFLLPGAEETRGYIALAVAALLAIPLIYLGIGCAFGMVELVHDRSASAISALRSSFAIVQGQRFAVLGGAFLVALIVTGGMLACCVGMIPAMAFGTLVYCSLFLALKTPTTAQASSL
jgi:hypothetical protein